VILPDVMTEIGPAYPNPASYKFTVDYTLNGQETAQLVLRNILGTAVREGKLFQV